MKLGFRVSGAFSELFVAAGPGCDAGGLCSNVGGTGVVSWTGPSPKESGVLLPDEKMTERQLFERGSSADFDACHSWGDGGAW